MNYLNTNTLEIILYFLTKSEPLNANYFLKREFISALDDFERHNLSKTFEYKIDFLPDGFSTLNGDFADKYLGSPFSDIKAFLDIESFPCSSLENCLFIMLKDKESLLTFIDTYIETYEKGKLISTNNNLMLFS